MWPSRANQLLQNKHRCVRNVKHFLHRHPLAASGGGGEHLRAAGKQKAHRLRCPRVVETLQL